MKKVIVVMALFLGTYMMKAQETAYKAALDYGVINSKNSPGVFSLSVRGSGFFTQLGNNLNVAPNSISFFVIDDVITYPNPITDYLINTSTEDGCYKNFTVPFEEFFIIGDGSECLTWETSSPFLVEIKPLAEINNTTTFIRRDCELKPLKLLEYDLYYITYRLLAWKTADPDNKVEIFPYQQNPTYIDFNIQDVSSKFIAAGLGGISYNNNISIQVEYKENPSYSNGSKDISDVLGVKFVACAPELESPPVVKNPTCNGGINGSATIVLKEDFPSGDQMQLQLHKKQNDGTFVNYVDVSPILLTENNFIGKRRYTFEFNGVTPTGDYKLVWPFGTTLTDEGESEEFKITEPIVLSLSSIINVKDITCTENGSIDITPLGGSGNYKYEWSGPDGASTIVSTNQDLSTIFSGKYKLKLIDADITDGSCYKDFSVTSPIGAPPESPEVSLVSSEDPLPTNGGKGRIGILVAKGSGSYTYTWKKDDVNFIPTSPSTNTLLQNLDSGKYTIQVTDTNGCVSDVKEYIIKEIPPLEVDFSTIGQVHCEGDTATILANAKGGNGTYTYSWSTNETADRITVEKGSYSVTVSSTGSSITKSYALEYVDRRDDVTVITEPLKVEVNSTNVLCKGDTTGSIDLTISGGTGNYQVFWNGVFTAFTEDRVNLAAGDYFYTVSDGNCETTNELTPIRITEPATRIAVTASSTDVTINNGTDGKITLSITNGGGSYTYAWKKGTADFFPTNGTLPNEFVGFSAGTYQVIITDENNNNCTATLINPITIEEPGPLELLDPQFEMTAVSCFDTSTGEITAKYTGTPPFNFKWYNSSGDLIKDSEEDFIVNQPEGFYTYVINDATNTSPITSNVIRITQPIAPVTATFEQTNVSCFGGNDGTIIVTPEGGSGIYSFEISGGAALQFTPGVFTNLAAGNYIINVEDSEECSIAQVLQVSIGAPNLITIDNTNTSITHVSTFEGTDGRISVTIEGGTSPYFYRWSGPDNPTPINTTNTTIISNLKTGDYILEVSNKNSFEIDGCYIRRSFKVNEPGPLSITSLSPTHVKCKGEKAGSIIAEVTGTEPIQYTWSLNGNVLSVPNTPVLNEAVAGTYTLTIDDVTATLAVSQNILVSEPIDELTAIGVATDVSCYAGEDGIVQINASGGTAPYTYSLDGINFETVNRFNKLSVGFYTIWVKDANECSFTVALPVEVKQPQQLDVIIDEQISLSAAGATDGQISITASGGTGDLTYNWSGPNGFASSSDDLTGLVKGDYFVTVTDENYAINNESGCVFVSNLITIAEPGELIVTNEQTVFLECNGDDFGEITARVTGGVEPYIYEWFEVVNGTNAKLDEDSEIIADLTAGEYFVRVTDANSVSKNAILVTIIQPDVLTIKVDATIDVICEEKETGMIDISVSGGTPPYKYIWSNGEITQDLATIPAGNYTIEVVDDKACINDETITINAPNNPIEIKNSIITSLTDYQSNDGRIELDIIGGLAPYAISWTRLSDTANIGENQETVSDLIADSYQVLIIDANGCEVSETYEITQPEIVEETISPITCFGASDASIDVLVNKGNGTFSYSWSTGATTNRIDNISAGNYTVTISGFGSTDLVRTYLIEDPIAINVDLGVDRVLCVDQDLVLDATIEDPLVSYAWTSDKGFTSSEPLITISEQGIYTVKIESATECIIEDSILITTSTDEISAEFAVSSQVFIGENLIAVDISYPLPDALEWIIPENAILIKKDSDELELIFEEEGKYEIGIRTTRGDCIAIETKQVLVVKSSEIVFGESKEDGRKLIEDFIIHPNPTDGKFTANVNLSERGNISIKIFSFASNVLIASEKARGDSEYSIPFDLSGVTTGVYAVLLETPYGNYLQKIVIK